MLPLTSGAPLRRILEDPWFATTVSSVRPGVGRGFVEFMWAVL
jgi:hypothetical protein